MALRSISAPSTYSFFFFFNELERREKGTAAVGAKTGLVAKTPRLVAIPMRFMAALFSTIKDLRADGPENHDSRALPARSLWKNRPAPPLPQGPRSCSAVSACGGYGGNRTARRPRDDVRRLLRASPHAPETRIQGRYAAGKKEGRGTAARRPHRLRAGHARPRCSVASVARSSRTDTCRPKPARRSSEIGVRYGTRRV